MLSPHDRGRARALCALGLEKASGVLTSFPMRGTTHVPPSEIGAAMRSAVPSVTGVAQGAGQVSTNALKRFGGSLGRTLGSRFGSRHGLALGLGAGALMLGAGQDPTYDVTPSSGPAPTFYP